MELKERLSKRLEQLQDEMKDLMKHRDFIEQQRQHIDVRLTQIAGALNELSVLQEEPVADDNCHQDCGGCCEKTQDQCANGSEVMIEQVNKEGVPI